MLQQAEALLKQYYGFDAFRQGQKQAIESIVNKVHQEPQVFQKVLN